MFGSISDHLSAVNTVAFEWAMLHQVWISVEMDRCMILNGKSRRELFGGLEHEFYVSIGKIILMDFHRSVVVFVPSTRIPKDIMKLAGQTTDAEVSAGPWQGSSVPCSR